MLEVGPIERPRRRAPAGLPDEPPTSAEVAALRRELAAMRERLTIAERRAVLAESSARRAWSLATWGRADRSS